MYYTGNRLYAPIKIGLTFSLVTFYFFLFGVWSFPYRDSAKLIILVLTYNLFMLAGFFWGTKLGVAYKPKVTPFSANRMFKKFINFVFIITVITFIPRFVIDTGFYDFDFGNLFYKIQMGLSDAHIAYGMNKYTASATGIWSYINLVCVATGFISWLYTSLSIITWHRINLYQKIFTIIYWVVIIMQNLAQGTNFGVFDLGIQIIVFYLIKTTIIKGEKHKTIIRPIKKPTKKQSLNIIADNGERIVTLKATSKKKYIFVAIVLLFILVNSFGNTMGSRVGEDYNRLVSEGYSYVQINTDSFIWKICPESIQPTIATLNSYVSHGYMGLAMAFDVPFTTTFGFGDSWFKLFNLEEYTNIDLLPKTYLMKIENLYGYSHSGYWHTAYLWFANDVSLYGVPIVLFILMCIYGFAWKDFLINKNPFALLLMSTFAVYFAFISANNQVFSSPNTLFAFWVMLIVWFRKRKKYDWSEVLD